MTIAVIAAQGRTGKIFVMAALKAGFQVRAGVRGRDDFSSHNSLETFECDGTKLDDVKKLVTGADVVVSLIGHAPHSTSNVQTTTIKNIVTALGSKKTQRVISLTGTGVRTDGDAPSGIDRLLNATVSLFDKARVEDGIQHLEILRSSALDWTVIRVLKLQNTKPRVFSLTPHGPAKLVTSRFEVAQAILDVIRDQSYVRECPVISRFKNP